MKSIINQSVKCFCLLAGIVMLTSLNTNPENFTNSYCVYTCNEVVSSKKKITPLNKSIKQLADGAALACNGDWVTVGGVIPSNNSYTKEAWIYRRGSGSNNIFSSQSEPFWLPSGRLTAGTQQHGIYALASPNIIPLNTWIHVAVTWEQTTSTLTLYESGVQVAQRTGVTTYSGGTVDICHHFGGSGTANVIMDEVRIWNTARDCAGIAVGADCELTGNEPGLLAYYQFNQGTAGANNTTIPNVIDSSPNANHGMFSTSFDRTGTNNNFVAPGGVVTGNTCPSSLITIEGNSSDILDDDVTPSINDDTDFGYVNLASGSETHTFTIRNNGPATANVNSIMLSGTNAIDFALSGFTAPAVLVGNGTITFQITFDPSATGIRLADIIVNIGTCETYNHIFRVQGNACNIAISGVTSTNETCSGAGDGTVTITATCGTCTAIEYSIDNGATYVQNGGSFTGLDDGTYTIIVGDVTNNTCTAAHTSTITIAVGTDNMDPTFGSTSIPLFSEDFESPTGTPAATGYIDCDLTTVTTYYGPQYLQSNTVETILINGPGNLYTDDALGTGGNYCLGIWNEQDDLLGLKFDRQGNNFINVKFDMTAMGLSQDGSLWYRTIPTTAIIQLRLYDNPTNSNVIVSPSGALLDQIDLTGNVYGGMPFQFDWKELIAGLDASGATNNNVLVRFDLISAYRSYAGIDNFVITASNTSIENLIPEDETIACLSDLPAPPASVAAEDNCDPNPVVTYVQTPASPINGDQTITRTWTATDASGNSTTQAQTITIDDLITPVFTNCPATASFTLDLCNELTISPADLGVTATDNCGTPTVTLSQTMFTASGVTNVTVTATDDATPPNTSTCVVAVTVSQNPDFFTITAGDDSFSSCAPTAVTFTDVQLLSNDNASNGNTLEIQEVNLTNASDGTLVDHNNGTYTFTPAPGFNGDAALTYIVKTDDATLVFTGNGHYYEFVTATGIDWPDAKTAAEGMTLYGLTGYLATITSQAENQFAQSKLQGQGWIGASDAGVEGNWQWVTGPEAGTQFWQGLSTGSVVNGMYENWANGEPNNSGNEDYAHFLTNGEWNDYAFNNNSIQGYVVEYGDNTGCIPDFTETGNITISSAPDIAAIGTQMNTCPTNNIDLTSITITDNNNVAGTTTTFHSAMPASGTDLTNQLASTTVSTDQTVFVMVANITGCYDVTSFLVDIVDCCNVAITNVTSTDEGCSGAGDGTITVTATCGSCTNGATDLEYSINGTNYFQNSGMFTGVSNGTYTVTARDVNSLSCSVSYSSIISTVVDIIPPQVSCKDFAVTINNTGHAFIVESDVVVSSSDNCNNVTTNLSKTDFTCQDVGANIVIITVTDDAGNVSTCSAIVTVDGAQIPSMTCPTSIGACTGQFNCNFIDLNTNTAGFVTASVSGSAAPFIQGDISPGGLAFFDPINLPSGVPLTLTYNLTLGDCIVSITCTFTVIDNKVSSGGSFDNSFNK